MTTLFVAMESALLVLRQGSTGWRLETKLKDASPQCVIADQLRPERVYCGTFEKGVWRSDDAGANWEAVGKGITHARVMSLAVSELERRAGFGVVYAGTEPSALFRSEDGGDTWEQISGLNALPSARTWSFPPRPHTHHVRWIALDPVAPGRLFVCIEAGAVVKSHDSGKTWGDRVPDGPYDTHNLGTHKLAPNRLYSAAGDGYFESRDAGKTWQRPRTGLRHHYIYGLAVDPKDPDTIIVSASSGPWQAHNSERAESFVYRRTDGESWEVVRNGLPPAQGTIISILAADRSGQGEFYLANNHGAFRSNDSGITWERLEVTWPQAYRSQHAWGVEVVEGD